MNMVSLYVKGLGKGLGGRKFFHERGSGNQRGSGASVPIHGEAILAVGIRGYGGKSRRPIPGELDLVPLEPDHPQVQGRLLSRREKRDGTPKSQSDAKD